jgi:hypothetical protein
MKKLIIEWRHFETGGQTCQRCGDTGETLRRVIEELSRELAGDGIGVTLTETHLLASSIAQSNMVLFNDVPLEDLLDEVEVSANECCSCSCLIGEDTVCRTLVYEGETYEDIPPELIRKAALKALNR